MSFKLSESHLTRLCEVNSFEVPGEGMVFFGLRGCLPIDLDNRDFRSQHELNVENTDNVRPRCTLVQWLPADGKFAVFPGSTVPCMTHIREALAQGGRGANQLMTGFYKDYRKGTHKNGSPTAHEAFRQTEGRPIRRTADDVDFDPEDRVEYENPCDNLHAAWCPSVNREGYASAGCQVVVGYPECEKRGGMPAVGPWKDFKENAYALDQQSFPYVLLEGRDAQTVALAKKSQEIGARLRFGSSGPLVPVVQEALKQAGFYEGNVDEDFGPRTIRAVLAFQKSAFGDGGEDGIVGSQTASALGLEWPQS